MSRLDSTYRDFAEWYDRWVLFEVLKSPHAIPMEITEGDFYRAQVELSTVMFSETDQKQYKPYSTADPRSVVANTALFIDISRDNQQWQRQWRRYSVDSFNQQQR